MAEPLEISEDEAESFGVERSTDLHKDRQDIAAELPGSPKLTDRAGAVTLSEPASGLGPGSASTSAFVSGVKPAPADKLPAPALSAGRVASVDALRGLTILLMIFVNDADGIGGERLPHWLEHANHWGEVDPATGRIDAMSVPDIVFPGFLFIAGVSIPLAFFAARRRGASTLSLLLKVLGRTGALLVMGVLMVNYEAGDPWPYHLWGIASYIGFLLAFSVLPKQPGKLRTVLWWGRWVGAAGLIALALVFTRTYQGNPGQHIFLGPLFGADQRYWLIHDWWGILGLIGWAYLVASIIYLMVGNRREWIIGAAAILSVIYLAVDSGMWQRFESRDWMEPILPLLRPIGDVLGFINGHVGFASTLGSSAAITTAGVALGTILLPGAGFESHRSRIAWGSGFAVFLFLLALMFDPITGLDKNAATPAWCMLTASIACAVWVMLYMVMDMMRFTVWAAPIRPAGQNPLLAYLLHPFLIWVVLLVGLNPNFYHTSDWPLAVNIIGSLAMAFLVVTLTGLIARLGIRLKV